MEEQHINDGDHDEKEYDHPAYAMLGASRVSGQTRLVGSELVHHSYIEVTLTKSTKHRRYSEDKFFGRKKLFKIAMSEAQWATFVSSMNMGDGVPVTLRYTPPLDSTLIEHPEITVSEGGHDKAKRELHERGKKITKDLQAEVLKLQEMAKSGAISKAALKDRISGLQMVMQDIVLNLPFLLEQHKEFMEKNVEAGKAEMEGFLLHLVTKTGLEQLRSGAPDLPLTIEQKKEKEDE